MKTPTCFDPARPVSPTITKAPETTFALFLGGPCDGDRLPVPGDKRVYAYMDAENVVTLYREESFEVEPMSRIRLFTSNGMTPAHALALLIAGYPRNR